MAQQFTADEFIQRASVFSSAKNKSAIDVWENYLLQVTKQPHALRLCLSICVADATSVTLSTALIAAQAVRSICTKRSVSLEEFSLLIRSCATVSQRPAASAVETQLTLALSSSMVFSLILQLTSAEVVSIDIAAQADFVDSRIREWLSLMDSATLSARTKLRVLSALPEQILQKDIKNACQSRGKHFAVSLFLAQTSLSAAAPVVLSIISQVLSSLCQPDQFSRLQCEGSIEEVSALPMISCDCLSSWLSFVSSCQSVATASTVLNKFEEVQKAVQLSAQRLSASRSLLPILGELLRALLRDCALRDSCTSLFESIASAFTATVTLQCENTNPQLVVTVEIMAALLSDCTQLFTETVSRSHASRYEDDLSQSFEALQRCIDLIFESFEGKILLSDGAVHMQAFLHQIDRLSATVSDYAQSLALHSAARSIHRDAVDSFSQHIAQSALFLGAQCLSVRSISTVPETDRQVIHRVLTRAVQSTALAVLALNEDASRGLAEQLSAFRSTMRDSLRDICDKYDWVFVFLLQSTAQRIHDVIESLANKQLTTIQAEECESWLHALSAALKSGFESHPDLLQSQVPLLKNVLSSCSSPHIASNRYFARLAVLIVVDICTFLVPICCSGIDDSTKERVPENDRVLFCMAFSALVQSLAHRESSKGSGANALTFRAKQDHVGVVSLCKLVDLLSSSLPKLSRSFCILDANRAQNALSSPNALLSASFCTDKDVMLQLESFALPNLLKVDDVYNSGCCAIVRFVVAGLLCIDEQQGDDDSVGSSRTRRMPLSKKSFGIAFTSLMTLLRSLDSSVDCQTTLDCALSLAIVSPLIHCIQQFPDGLTVNDHVANAVQQLGDRLSRTLSASLATHFLTECLRVLTEKSCQLSLYLLNLRILVVRRCIGTVLSVGDNHLQPDVPPQRISQLFAQCAALITSMADELLSVRYTDGVLAHELLQLLDELMQCFGSFCNSYSRIAVRSASQFSRALLTVRQLLKSQSLSDERLLSSLSDLFLKFFEQISTVGVRCIAEDVDSSVATAEDEQQLEEEDDDEDDDDEMFGLHRDSDKQRMRSQKDRQTRSLCALLHFWIDGLSLTQFGSMCIVHNTTKKRGVSSSDTMDSLLPWSSLRWETIRSIAEVTMRFLQPMFLPSLSASICDQVISVLHLCIGPIVDPFVSQSHMSFSDMITANVCCSDAPQGITQVMQCYNECQLSAQLIHSLTCAMHEALPARCRDEAVRLLIHCFWAFGAALAAQAVLHSLREFESEDRAVGIASQLHSSALCGDWKRFKSALKNVWR